MIFAFLLATAIFLCGRLVYEYRYRIVAEATWLDGLYGRFGIESMYRGRDIKIEDVQIKEVTEKGLPYIEVSGRLHNTGKQTVRLLPVKVSVINQNNEIENEAVEILPEHRVDADFSVLFRVLLEYPSDYASKIRITLEDTKQDYNT